MIKLTYGDQYLVKEILQKKDSVKIVFRHFIVFEHDKIADTLLSPNFAISVSGTIKMKKFAVTTGGFETRDGFQYTVYGFFNPQAERRIEYDATNYPVKLKEDELVSEMQFVYSTRSNIYSIILSSDYLEIKPKPPTQIVKTYIRALKESLTESPHIFLQSAEEKLKSAMLNFSEGRYRSVPHDAYYALHNVVQSIAVQSGMDSKIGHDAKTQKILSKILYQIASGNHIAFRKYDVWKKHKCDFQLIDSQRYSNIARDLYEMRRLADYTPVYEIAEFITKLSDLMLKVEELLNLAHYVEEGSIAFADGRLVRIFHEERELEPYPDEMFRIQRLEKGGCRFLQKGLILAENFDLNKFLVKFLSLTDIYYVRFSPSRLSRRLYVKYEKRGTKRKFSITFSKKLAMEHSYMPLTIETVKKWSQIIKPDEIKLLKLKKVFDPRKVVFSDGKYFFELYILPDGRFYMISPLDEQKPNDQIAAILKLREVIAKTISSIWEYCSTISFSAISIIAK